MIVCELCSGRHETRRCIKGSGWVEQCMSGTPDDYRPLPDNVIQLVTAYTYRKQTASDLARRRRVG